MAEFKAEVFQNEYLTEGATDVHAVVSVSCTGAGTAGQSGRVRGGRDHHRRHVGLDGHAAQQDRGSPPRRQGRARTRSSTARGSPSSPGTRVAQMVYPTHPGMAKMTDVTRRDASEAVGGLRSGGATAIGAWIAAATELFEQAPAGAASRHPADRRQDRGRAAKARSTSPSPRPRGKFQCDCRGHRHRLGGRRAAHDLERVARHGRHRRQARGPRGRLRGR